MEMRHTKATGQVLRPGLAAPGVSAFHGSAELPEPLQGSLVVHTPSPGPTFSLKGASFRLIQTLGRRGCWWQGGPGPPIVTGWTRRSHFCLPSAPPRQSVGLSVLPEPVLPTRPRPGPPGSLGPRQTHVPHSPQLGCMSPQPGSRPLSEPTPSQGLQPNPPPRWATAEGGSWSARVPRR